ncbi:hypothetical protein NDU88_003958 [Pleurodeles waltl]|uniref:Uncharacterized protein n=1 Tax=Pleurodeles waltl TaxID=8319 RepID=A0AAV7W632_PLEWA|nr:hypothetical protein NDU88_003958 [Pleurodeles waltl]
MNLVAGEVALPHRARRISSGMAAPVILCSPPCARRPEQTVKVRVWGRLRVSRAGEMWRQSKAPAGSHRADGFKNTSKVAGFDAGADLDAR